MNRRVILIGDNMNLKGAVEAVLFASGDPVSPDALAEACSTEEEPVTRDQIEEVLRDLQKTYDADDRGIRLIRLEDKAQLCTREAYYDVLSRAVNLPEKHVLTDVLLETLSIVAYKQPVTRPEIEKIRGVSSAHAINRLIDYHLIEEVGRLDAPGHPILFGTTDDFLRSFGISSMDDLPDISPDKVADFRKQAEEEAQQREGLEVPV